MCYEEVCYEMAHYRGCGSLPVAVGVVMGRAITRVYYLREFADSTSGCESGNRPIQRRPILHIKRRIS